MSYNGVTKAYNGVLPEFRLTADSYDGVEFTESMTAGGVVYTAEGGYLEVEKHQNVLIWPNTATNGHGGNRFEEYVWGRTVAGAVGWLPLNFRIEFAGMGFICPEELATVPEEMSAREVHVWGRADPEEETAAIAATDMLPDLTASIAATGLLPAETAAVAATGLPSVAGTERFIAFDC
jgi:hypothetical protein